MEFWISEMSDQLALDEQISGRNNEWMEKCAVPNLSP